MDRKEFLMVLATLPIIGKAMGLKKINKLVAPLVNTEKMPVLFLGHGDPMNAILENEFTREFKNLGSTITKPNAILCISAHWETKGTFVTAMETPRTIHDFGGFPQELYNVQYPAPGSPELANQTKKIITKTEVGLDKKWGLDHGSWTVVKHMYPNADIPIIQMSLDYSKSPKYHYELAKDLASLREKGVLIVGSGNMVHNLGLMAWKKSKENEYGFDWAIEANEKFKELILSDNHSPLINYSSQGKAFNLAIPTPDHFLPLLYTLALKEDTEEVTLFNDKTLGGSFSMTSLKIDKRT